MHPFREQQSSTFFRDIVNAAIREIHLLDNEYVLKASAIELEEYFAQKAIIEPVTLHSEQITMKDRTSTQIDVSNAFHVHRRFPSGPASERGTKIDIAIPFEGDPRLWRVRPSSCSAAGYPEIAIEDTEIILSISFLDASANSSTLKTELDREMKSLEDAVKCLRCDVNIHNNSIPDTVRLALKKKKESAQAAIQAVAALEIPLKRVDPPPVFAIPVNRRRMPITKPSVGTGPYQSEPVLNENEYEYILGIMKSMSLVIERSPTSFASLDEESIRNHFLIQLNGHYEGKATGETLNGAGKTDILIREGNRNVFIAECKFWRGPKGFVEAVRQLLT